MTIELTQFFRPNGRSERVTTEIPDDLKSAYEAMISKSLHLECEVLQTGWVSVTLSSLDEDVDSSTTPNGPEVQNGIVKMLKRNFS